MHCFNDLLVPTLANFINNNLEIIPVVWDGSIAPEYKSGNGTKDNHISSLMAELLILSIN